MSIANWIFKKKVRKFAGHVIKNEEAIDGVVDRVLVRLVKKLSNWLVRINWGHLAGGLARKLVGLLK
ncbi:hypothetical protein LCGC14_2087420 [marine sediment metagenome]|uniref:Uncharacterized protein n=1 Tax=marine sediment metagenome TaxID=412755 RepID=A0A0F9EDM5_9ZZZZ|nr:hypothetical protein [Candidatus Aminicenantes bacterium]